MWGKAASKVSRCNKTAISSRSSATCSAIRSVRSWLSTRGHWPWSSLRFPHLSDPAPIEAPTGWLQWINQPLVDHELTTLRNCVKRRQSFGAADWQATIADDRERRKKSSCPLFFQSRSATAIIENPACPYFLFLFGHESLVHRRHVHHPAILSGHQPTLRGARLYGEGITADLG